MEAAGTVLLILVLVLCLLSLFAGLPGTWGMAVAGGIYAWATGFERVPPGTVALLFAAAAGGEVLEYVLAAREARRFGASAGGACAALAGGLVGGIVTAPLLAGVGALVGLLAGALLGAAAYEWWAGRSFRRALKSGWGALRGRLWGTLAKVGIGLLMIVFLLGRIL